MKWEASNGLMINHVFPCSPMPPVETVCRRLDCKAVLWPGLLVPFASSGVCGGSGVVMCDAGRHGGGSIPHRVCHCSMWSIAPLFGSNSILIVEFLLNRTLPNTSVLPNCATDIVSSAITLLPWLTFTVALPGTL